ncbi:MAG: lipoyl synthase [Nitrospira sp.]|nr:lipoyl synthase [Candidatus Manganitrophaceae bacterium]HIL34821.1 lipoyl synthase [Candidatus Manganitrophaceae bacterium]
MPEQHFLTPPQRRTERLPSWFKVKRETGENYLRIRHLAKRLDLHTVCEEARCPNIWECWNNGTATFMILGEICTRSCGFCAVQFGRPNELDQSEPAHLAEAVAALDLGHAVITSVNRDELDNGGAEIFAESIRQIRARSPKCTLEVLIPDFQGKKNALEIVLAASPDILAHNIETVPRLYRQVRPQARYERSLQVLVRAKIDGLLTKTGLMLGLGETIDEVRNVMADLAEVGCDILTLGQYLQPTALHLPIDRFVHPDEFAALKREGEEMGLSHVESGPLVRSSYHAEAQAGALPMAR